MTFHARGLSPEEVAQAVRDSTQPKPVQDRPLGENLHKDLHSYPSCGRKSSEIQDVAVSHEALKSPRRLGLFRKWLAPPSQQWRRAARPATNALTRKGGPMPASLSIPSPALEGAPLPHFCKGPPPPVCSASLTVVAQRAWRNGRRSGLEENLSARPETGDAELPKFGEPSHMAIPSQARSQPNREGVETRRAAPNPGFHPGHGEGIVQTANLASLLPSAVSQDGESRRR